MGHSCPWSSMKFEKSGVAQYRAATNARGSGIRVGATCQARISLLTRRDNPYVVERTTTGGVRSIAESAAAWSIAELLSLGTLAQLTRCRPSGKAKRS